jgi:uncharacterized protein
MSEMLAKPCTAFIARRLAVSGPLIEVALAVKDLGATEPTQSILVFDDTTGRVVDLDLRGNKTEIVERLLRGSSLPAPTTPTSDNPPATSDEQPGQLEARAEQASQSGEKNGRGRPKLGVTAREVTLLPRHWVWLAAQPGGASVTLRKLVEDARRNSGAQQKLRQSQEAAYRFMSAMGGDFPGFEEATRALFADDRAHFEQHMTEWPVDIRNHAIRLAFGTEGLL